MFLCCKNFKRSVLTERSLLGRFFSHEVRAKYQWIQQVASQFCCKLRSAWATHSSSWQRDFWITVIDFSLNGLENKIVLEDFANLHNLKQLLLLLRSMSLISGEEKQPKWPWKTETSGKTNRGQPPAPGMDVQTAAEEADDRFKRTPWRRKDSKETKQLKSII